MATDRIVSWQDVVPSMADIATALEDYIGDKIQHDAMHPDLRRFVSEFDRHSIGNILWHEETARWRVRLRGKSSHPQQRLLPGGPTVTMREERWFEVVPCDDHLDIITRDQSPLVQAIADGFVKFVVDFWRARPEEEE